jgi:hypothetical protein
MKKLVLISVIIFLSGINFLMAQDHNQLTVLPIPSFGVQVKGAAAFQELSNAGAGTRERREINIQTSSTSHGMTTGDALVLVYKVQGYVVVGRYYVAFGETLTVPVDNEEYGVGIQSTSEATVNVWFGNSLY